MSACLRRVIQCQYTCGNVCLFGPLHIIWASSLNCRLMTKLQPGTVILTKHFSSKKPDQICLKTPDLNTDKAIGQPTVHPEKGELVYSGQYCKRIKGLKWFSLISSVGLTSALPFLPEANQVPLIALGVIGLSFCSPPILIHSVVVQKYVTDIYFNEKTEKFQLATWSFFMRRKEMEYTTKDVVIVDPPEIFRTHKIKGKPVTIDKTGFTSKKVYKYMVGYHSAVELNMPDDEQ